MADKVSPEVDSELQTQTKDGVGAGGPRGEMARRFIEPNYETIEGIEVIKLRNFFAEFCKTAQTYGERVCIEAGGDPAKPMNGHHANIHHTNFLTQLDGAKDSFIKWILATVAKQAEDECVVQDDVAAQLFGMAAKRKRGSE